MGYKTALKECLRECEKRRAKAEQEIENRTQEIYRLIPRIKAIDHELSLTGVKITRLILNHSGDTNRLVAELEETNQSLQEEKEALLREKGIVLELSRFYTCAECKDTGFVGHERCSCLKQMLIDKHYDLSNLHGLLETENFENFDIRYYSDEPDAKHGLSPKSNIAKIYRSCLEFVENFDYSDTNLLFYGDTGMGKTFLCNCIARDLLDKGKTVLYITAPKLFKIFEDHRFRRAEEDEPDENIEMVNRVDLFIIDDLGTEFPNIVSQSELFNIINSRILLKKHTIISTNLYPNEFETLYSQRIISRFVGNYMMFKFFGQDIRMIKKYS